MTSSALSAEAAARAALIAVDWGTSRCRAMLLDRDGAVIAEADSVDGIGPLGGQGHEDAFESLTAGWPRVPALMAGMVGSRQGWREAAYVPVPATSAALAAGLCRFEDTTHRPIAIVPGIVLRSADPLVPPLIEPNSLSAPQDLDELVEGALLLRKLAAALPLAEVIAEEIAPGPAVATRDEIAADIRARASSVFHPVGTCRMGRDPREAVVDARLRAHGLSALRIVDASVFPSVTSGNTNTPVLMVAERGAQFILEDAA